MSQRSDTLGPVCSTLVTSSPDVEVRHVAEGLRRGRRARQRPTGAYAVCVGTAITHPTTITGWIRDAMELGVGELGVGELDGGQLDGGEPDGGEGRR